MNSKRRRALEARVAGLENQFAAGPSPRAIYGEEVQDAAARLFAGRADLEDFWVLAPDRVSRNDRSLLYYAMQARMARLLYGSEGNWLSLPARIASHLPTEPPPLRLVEEFEQTTVLTDDSPQGRYEVLMARMYLATLRPGWCASSTAFCSLSRGDFRGRRQDP